MDGLGYSAKPFLDRLAPFVHIVYLSPRCGMWLLWVEKTFHAIFEVIPEIDVINPGFEQRKKVRGNGPEPRFLSLLSSNCSNIVREVCAKMAWTGSVEDRSNI